jgi:phosphatidylserine decarboxylase
MLRLSDDITMKAAMFRRIAASDRLNFVLTNHIPRALATRLMGRFSRIRSPLLTRLLIAVWRLFTDLDLSDARRQQFDSLQECFTRELLPGARPFDPRADVLCSPCDAIVGACGRVQDGALLQAKGMPYRLSELFGAEHDHAPWIDGHYVTLRLTSAMYHRFHSPQDAMVERVTYLSGDTWNVNPPTLARIDRLFCRNERAAIHMRLSGGEPVALVAVAAILVASIRLRFIETPLNASYRGPLRVECGVSLSKGEEMGWFEHGSTIILFAPAGMAFCSSIAEGVRVRAGEPLLRLQSTISSRPS